MNAFNTREAEDYDAYAADDARLRGLGWAGLPALTYARISEADERDVKRAGKKLDPDAKRAALTAKRDRHQDEMDDFADSAGLDVKARFKEDNMSASAYRPRKDGHLVPLPRRAALLRELDGYTSDVVVLATEVSRLYRDERESEEIIDHAIRLNQQVVSARLIVLDISENVYDLSTEPGRSRFRADIKKAADESGTIARRRRRKERVRAKAGHYLGRRPFGYLLDYDDAGTYTGLLRVKDGTGEPRPGQDGYDPRPGTNPGVDEAAMIRQAAGRIIREGRQNPGQSPSLYGIAKEWNAAGVLTTWGNPWTAATLKQTLTNELYAGWRLHRPGSVDGRPPAGRRPKRTRAKWPAILDQDEMDEVTAILTDAGRRTNPGGWEGRRKTPLSSLAYCGAVKDDGEVCGARLTGAPARQEKAGKTEPCPLCGEQITAAVDTVVRVETGGQVRRVHDRCGRPLASRRLRCPAPPAGCGGVGRAMDPVEDLVRDLIMFWRDSGLYAQCLAARRSTADLGALNERKAALETQIKDQDDELTRWKALLAATKGDPAAAREVLTAMDGARNVRASLAADLGAVERQIAAADPGADDADDALDFADDAQWDAATPGEQREWFRKYVAKVIISPNRPGTAHHWFDPRVVQVIPGPWADEADPAELAAPDRLLEPVRPPAPPARYCKLDDCGEVHDANGYCRLHNRRQWEAAKAGHPDKWDRGPSSHRGRPAPGSPPRLCDLDDCGNPHDSNGLCNGHMLRKRTAERKGTPDAWDRSPIPPRKPRRPRAA